MRYNFNMVIGDYFGDGHGRTQSFHIGTDKPIKDVLEAQTPVSYTHLTLPTICSV